LIAAALNPAVSSVALAWMTISVGIISAFPPEGGLVVPQENADVPENLFRRWLLSVGRYLQRYPKVGKRAGRYCVVDDSCQKASASFTSPVSRKIHPNFLAKTADVHAGRFFGGLGREMRPIRLKNGGRNYLTGFSS
jgi:hypothetical protein